MPLASLSLDRSRLPKIQKMNGENCGSFIYTCIGPSASVHYITTQELKTFRTLGVESSDYVINNLYFELRNQTTLGFSPESCARKGMIGKFLMTIWLHLIGETFVLFSSYKIRELS